MSALGSPVKGSVKAPDQTSSKLMTSVGSGSRPGKTSYPIKSSAPADPRMLDGRGDVKGALGMGDESRRQD